MEEQNSELPEERKFIGNKWSDEEIGIRFIYFLLMICVIPLGLFLILQGLQLVAGGKQFIGIFIILGIIVILISFEFMGAKKIVRIRKAHNDKLNQDRE